MVSHSLGLHLIAQRLGLPHGSAVALASFGEGFLLPGPAVAEKSWLGEHQEPPGVIAALSCLPRRSPQNSFPGATVTRRTLAAWARSWLMTWWPAAGKSHLH